MYCQSRKDPDAERATDARSAAYGVRPPSGAYPGASPLRASEASGVAGWRVGPEAERPFPQCRLFRQENQKQPLVPCSYLRRFRWPGIRRRSPADNRQAQFCLISLRMNTGSRFMNSASSFRLSPPASL